MIEARASLRVWKTTLTFSPSYAEAIKWRARRLAIAKAGDPWELRTYDEQCALLQKAAGRYLTLALKRMRKGRFVGRGKNRKVLIPPLKFRYLITTEFHKSGVPHFHAVFHELETMTKRQLEASWPYGFSKFKLVPVGAERDAIRYATKYAAKDCASRIRASIRYGVAGELGSAVDDRKVLERSRSAEAVTSVDSGVEGFPKGKTPPDREGRDQIQSGPSEARVPGALWRWDNAERAALDATWVPLPLISGAYRAVGPPSDDGFREEQGEDGQ